MLNAEVKRGKRSCFCLPTSAFRLPPSYFRLPPSAFILQASLLRLWLRGAAQAAGEPIRPTAPPGRSAFPGAHWGIQAQPRPGRNRAAILKSKIYLPASRSPIFNSPCSRHVRGDAARPGGAEEGPKQAAIVERALLRTYDAAHVRVQAICDIGCNPRGAALCAEYDVQQDLGVCTRHDNSFAPSGQEKENPTSTGSATPNDGVAPPVATVRRP